MYKYSADPKLKERFLFAKKQGNVSEFVKSVVTGTRAAIVFEKFWVDSVFFSDTKRDVIPILDSMYDVKYFKEEVI